MARCGATGDLRRQGSSTRRWIAITAAASAGAEVALGVHVTSALRSGDITIDEMREAVAHFAVYQGYPRATIFHLAVEESCAKLSADPDG